MADLTDTQSTASAVSSSDAVTRPSTPPTSTHTMQDAASDASVDHDSDSESSVVSSSSDESDGSSEEPAASDSPPIVTVGGPKKPQMHYSADALRDAQDLKSRLSAFLPQMAAANQQLAAMGPGHTLEDVDEDGQYIEMDLGLGVLKETNGESSSDEENDDEDGAAREGQKDQTSRADKEKNVMGKLMGTPKTQGKPGIEEV